MLLLGVAAGMMMSPLIAQREPGVLEPGLLPSAPIRPVSVTLPAAAAAAAPPAGAHVPAVHIEKQAPAAINLGQPLVYEIIVRNVGSVPVAQVKVQDMLPDGARFLQAEPFAEVADDQLTWSLDKLDVGEERRLRVHVEPLRETHLNSTATVTYAIAGMASAGMKTHITKPRLLLTKTGPATVLLNDPAVFEIELANVGSGPATGVVLQDFLPAALRHPQGEVIEAEVGTLAAGETKKITLTTTAVALGQHVNEAQVVADGGIEEKAQAAFTVLQPGLELRKRGSTHCYTGQTADFDLEVTNTGTAPATNVQVLDVLPEGLEFLYADNGGIYDQPQRRVMWRLGTLAPGERRGLMVKLMCRAPGTWTNRATASADRDLADQAEAQVTVTGVPGLMLALVDLDDPVEVGAETTYEIRVVSQGGCVCHGVYIVAEVPARMQPLSAEGPTPHRLRGQKVIFEPLDKLAARADLLYRVRVQGLEAGDVRFKVWLHCDYMNRPVYAEESTTIYE